MGFQALWGITYLCHGAKFVIFPSASNKDLTTLSKFFYVTSIFVPFKNYICIIKPDLIAINISGYLICNECSNTKKNNLYKLIT